MEERPLGASGLSVPVVGMGTWKTFDVQGADKNARKRMVREALDLDVRLYDTSPMYGQAQDVLADALRGARDEAIVADKVWAGTKEEGLRQIARALDLYEGTVEVFQVHNLRLWSDFLPELEKRKKADEVLAVGVTHYNHAAFGELEEVMKTGRLDMVQIPYNLLDREVEKRILPLADKMGLGVLVMEPLGTGALARKTPAPEQVEPFLGNGVTTWAQVCLKWVLSDPRVTCVIPATSNPDHMRQNAAAGEGPWFDPKERDAIADLLG